MKTPEQRHPHLAALESIEDGMRSAFARGGGNLLRPRPDLLHVIEPEGDTFIAAVAVPPQQLPEDEPQAVCMVTVSALLKDRPRLTDEQINACNRYAAMSLMLRQQGQQQVMAVNSFTIYDDPEQRSRSLYMAMQTAVLQRTWLSQVLFGVEDDFRRPLPFLDPETANLPSKWTSTEIALLYDEVVAAQYKARLQDPNSLVIYLSKTNVRGQGSFIFVRNDVAHPLYGNGLSVTLVMPEEVNVTSDQLEKRALEWNRRESLSIMPVPCIGAWSTRIGHMQMQHQTFAPNVIYAPGVGNLVLEAAVQRWAVAEDAGSAI